MKEFQLKNKMNVDGKVGANTWNVLYTRYTAKHGLHVPYPGIALRSALPAARCVWCSRSSIRWVNG